MLAAFSSFCLVGDDDFSIFLATFTGETDTAALISLAGDECSITLFANVFHSFAILSVLSYGFTSAFGEATLTCEADLRGLLLGEAGFGVAGFSTFLGVVGAFFGVTFFGLETCLTGVACLGFVTGCLTGVGFFGLL